jgi:hypothetical protein
MYEPMTHARWSGVDENDVEATEIDLRDRLLFAAGSLAADFGDELSVDLAETLVFSSAQGLLVSASVTEFVPILAERRARQPFRAAARSSVPVPRPSGPMVVPVPAPRPAPPFIAPPPAPPVAVSAAAPAGASQGPAPGSDTDGVAPLLSVPQGDMTRLRDEVERARVRVAEWTAELGRRGVDQR